MKSICIDSLKEDRTENKVKWHGWEYSNATKPKNGKGIIIRAYQAIQNTKTTCLPWKGNEKHHGSWQFGEHLIMS